MGGYLSEETNPKTRTGKDDIAPGSIKLRHLSPELFLELESVKLHTHEGADSRTLGPSSTPFMVRGKYTGSRIEHGVVTWSGVASVSGTLSVTLATPFSSTPNVFVTPARSTADVQVSVSSVASTGFTINWKLDSGTLTSLDFQYILVGI